MNASSPKTARRTLTLLATAFGIGIVFSLGLWDVRNADQLALRRMMQAHHLLATTLATSLQALSRDVPNASASDLAGSEATRLARVRGAVSHFETTSGLVVLLWSTRDDEFWESSGRRVSAPELAAAMKAGVTGTVLSRDLAASIGLPRRTAVAGLAQPPEYLSGRLRGLAVITSARAERDRTAREQWRTVMVAGLASLLIAVVGVVALRAQRRDLELAHERAVHRMERARDADLSRSNRLATVAALASGIAHEISTPLGVISGRVEQLQNARQDEERFVRALSTISAQIQRIDQIMRGFLAFARGEAPILSHRLANDVAENAAKLVQYRFGRAGVDLKVHPCPHDSLQIACEPSLFEQALIDILVNALQASNSGQRVDLSVTYDSASVSFLVEDEGVGIDDSVVARATEPFFTTKAGVGGTGLGLTIAKEILVHHGGDISFQTRDAKTGSKPVGTRVIVRLPRIEEKNSENKSRHSNQA